MTKAQGKAVAKDCGRATRITTALTQWFRANARDLPWRATDAKGRRNAYHALVAEAMLQQTQVSRVLEKYSAFIARFPDVHALANATEEEVLSAWSGLGYYRRARHLHHAAKNICKNHEGKVPEDAESLRRLPGVGRYTAGAIASIVYGHAEPVVDGNVTRVQLRLEASDQRQGEPATERWAWKHASDLVARAADPGAFNEAMMELGATVCTPGVPRCEACPLRKACRAASLGLASTLPVPKVRAGRRAVYHSAVVIRDRQNRLLIQRRPERGLWAGMYQAPTVEREDRAATASEIKKWFGLARIVEKERFVFLTTHREVHFAIFTSSPPPSPPAAARWACPSEIAALPLANPHRRILLGEETIQTR
ncbi:MAG: A/G-specific adenine glycosylase [Phycisphaeraceae bacterium]|nr:MAG: A/G-specific adenine glycosylase [Phycisphaeraceae bacterium]